MQAACSSMLFGIQIATDAINSGSASCVLVISPEICTARVCFQDRETHFLFGDAAAALVIEKMESCQSDNAYEIMGTKLYTQFSETVNNHFGFLNQTSTSEDRNTSPFVQPAGKKTVQRNRSPSISSYWSTYDTYRNCGIRLKTFMVTSGQRAYKPFYKQKGFR